MTRWPFARTLVASFAALIGGLKLNAVHFGYSSILAPGTTAPSLAAAATFASTLAWVQGAGYLLIFLAMFIEGPIVTAAAAFASALGYFNVWAIFVLAILGDLIPDLLFYAVGYVGRIKLIERYGHRFGLSTTRMHKIETLLRTHRIKTLIFIKFAPVLPTPGLMLVGAIRMPLREYTVLSILIGLPKTVLFMVVGYYFGTAYTTFATYLESGVYVVLVAIVATLGVWWAYTKVTQFVSRQLVTV